MFERITPEEAGISSDYVTEFITRLEKRGCATHSVLMMKGDKIFAEYYWAPFHKDFLHRMYSQTKSYVAVAIGLLVEEGKLSLDDKIVDWFPEKIESEQHEYMKDQTVRDMLTMRTVGNPKNWFTAGDPDRTHLYFEPRASYRPSRTLWEYDSPGSQVLCNLVEKISGMSLFDYLKSKIFDELGTFKTATILKTPNGDSWGDSALLCTTRDMASFGRFVMNYGTWNGKRLMNEAYLREATSKVVDNRLDSYEYIFSHGYGYQIWRLEENGFAFNGMGSQYTLCFPDKDVILVITSDNQGFDFAKVTIVGGFIDSILHHIDEKPKKPSKAAEKRLVAVTRNLKLRAVQGLDDSPVREQIDGKKFICEPNHMGITEFTFKFNKNKTGTFNYKNGQGKKTIKFGINKNVFGKFPQLGYSDGVGGAVTTDGFMYDDAVSAAWTCDGKLILKVQIIDKYFGNMSVVFAFKGDTVVCNFTKCAEAFLDEYAGRFIAKMKQ